MQITPDLPAPLVPLAWLVGTWEGVGVTDRTADRAPDGPSPDGESQPQDAQFGQEVTFAHEGLPFLRYESRTWLLEENGAPGEPLYTETGFWRPLPGLGVEVLLAHPDGVVEVYLGTVDGARVELRTDVVARTDSPKEQPGYSAGHRLYGGVEGDLLWVYEVAARERPLAPLMSARLKRVGGG